MNVYLLIAKYEFLLGELVDAVRRGENPEKYVKAVRRLRRRLEKVLPVEKLNLLKTIEERFLAVAGL